MTGLALVGLWVLLACQQAETPQSPEVSYELELPAHFPSSPALAAYDLTPEKVALGKRLFFDVGLSRDSSLSCAACHLSEAGFADHAKVSIGVDGRTGFRNVPTLANIGYHPYFFREGGSPTLHQQALGPIEDHNEMDLNPVALVARLKTDATYQRLAEEAYDRPMGVFVLTRALAAFQHTLISGNAPYDAFLQGDSSALSPAAQRGESLFFSERTQCGNCHGGLDLSTYQLENNGLYESYQDLGRYRVSLDSADIGKFKVPSLRNIAQTWPYMHDGSLPNLAAVIEHYNQGGVGHPNQSDLIRPLGLTDAEKADLLAFLHSLSDPDFLAGKTAQLLPISE
ncbi:MAG: cytochrome c peroxidase [Bacteroidota bacterium]